MATYGEIQAFENFKFRIGDMVLRATNNGDDKGIVVGRLLAESTAGMSRVYVVAFDSTVNNQQFDEIELRPFQ